MTAQITLLFVLMPLLEVIGYMSRAAFVMDRVMARTGLIAESNPGQRCSARGCGHC
ncbi:hypothetical protein [Mycolicibacter engbaekii]|uniref:hypothetical protein n=1 Tax=Mycolicibacter engbaekii TaxID=188915 RepID=UPI0013FD399B|nr:hypothetical protein [Mycolicibacter engbaekii]